MSFFRNKLKYFLPEYCSVFQILVKLNIKYYKLSTLKAENVL